MSCEIFLGIPGILVDFDDLFSWILHKNPRNLCETYGYLRKFLGNYRILMPSCDIFLGIRSTFWDSGENLLLDATKIPRSLWIFSG